METSPEIQQLDRLARVLDSCDLALAQAEDEAWLLHRVCEIVVQEGAFAAAWVGVAMDDLSKSVQPVAQSGYERGYLDDIEVTWDELGELGRGPVGSAIRTGNTQIIPKLVTNPAMLPWWEAAIRRGYLSIISLPFRLSDGTRCALTIYASEFDAFSSAHAQLFETLCARLRAAVDAIRARRGGGGKGV